MKLLKSLLNDDRGQDLVEYGLLVGMIAMAVIAAVTSVGIDLRNLFQRVADTLPTAQPGQ